MNKRFHAPAALALGVVILLTVIIVSLMVHVGLQNDSLTRHGVRDVLIIDTERGEGINQLRNDLTQGRI